jgi:hypothetical protein
MNVVRGRTRNPMVSTSTMTVAWRMALAIHGARPTRAAILRSSNTAHPLNLPFREEILAAAPYLLPAPNDPRRGR